MKEIEAGLRMRGLSVHLGGAAVLNAIDLDLMRGECLALLGPSGCGKSTLLRTLAGLQRVTSGSVYFGGQDWTHRPPQRRRVGMLFQHYALFPQRTVAQNIAYGLEAQGVARALRAERIDQLLELVGLSTLRDRYPAQLSGGQQQRAALARALAPSPALLLMDEPFSALDEHLRGQLRVQIREILDQLGQTAIIVTHDRSEAWEMADRVAVMHAGRVLRVDTPTAWLSDSGGELHGDLRTFLGGFNQCRVQAQTVTVPVRSIALRAEVPVDRQGGGVALMARVERVTLHPFGWLLQLSQAGSSEPITCLARWGAPEVGQTLEIWFSHQGLDAREEVRHYAVDMK